MPEPTTLSCYQLPRWAHLPYNDDENGWLLEEIKNGTIVNKHQLRTPVITFGRSPMVGPGPGDCNKSCEIDVDYKPIATSHESECLVWLNIKYFV